MAAQYGGAAIRRRRWLGDVARCCSLGVQVDAPPARRSAERGALFPLAAVAVRNLPP